MRRLGPYFSAREMVVKCTPMQLASSLANNPFSFRQRLSSSPVIFYARRVCLWPNCRSTVKSSLERLETAFPLPCRADSVFSARNEVKPTDLRSVARPLADGPAAPDLCRDLALSFPKDNSMV
jgi:hypothetical protein